MRLFKFKKKMKDKFNSISNKLVLGVTLVTIILKVLTTISDEMENAKEKLK